MLVVGTVGWGKPHPTSLTPDEQYTHISLWCLLSAPLLIGCDMIELDDFTLSLLTNDEVLAIDQDALGQAGDDASPRTATATSMPRIWRTAQRRSGCSTRQRAGEGAPRRFADLKLDGKQTVRDLWRQKDVGQFENAYEAKVAPHGVVLVKISK